MKKRFYVIVLAIMLIITASGCKKTALPQAELPLKAEAITAVLRASGLPYAVADENTWMEEQLAYELHDENGKLFGVVSSYGGDDMRYLSVVFSSQNPKFATERIGLTEGNWEKGVNLASLLYGGFDNEKQRYKEFSRAKLVDIPREEPSKGSADLMQWNLSVWEKKLGDIYCSATIQSGGQDLNVRYLSGFSFYNEKALAHFQEANRKAGVRVPFE